MPDLEPRALCATCLLSKAGRSLREGEGCTNGCSRVYLDTPTGLPGSRLGHLEVEFIVAVGKGAASVVAVDIYKDVEGTDLDPGFSVESEEWEALVLKSGLKRGMYHCVLEFLLLQTDDWEEDIEWVMDYGYADPASGDIISNAVRGEGWEVL